MQLTPATSEAKPKAIEGVLVLECVWQSDCKKSPQERSTNTHRREHAYLPLLHWRDSDAFGDAHHSQLAAVQLWHWYEYTLPLQAARGFNSVDCRALGHWIAP
eukprot:5520547-Amphidinium_carterae.1